MLVKVSELQEKPLDYAVITANGWLQDYLKYGFRLGNCDSTYSPSTDWSQAGPIIDKEKIYLEYWDEVKEWIAGAVDGNTEYFSTNPLVAAMRCYVASKLGDTIDVPEELLK